MPTRRLSERVTSAAGVTAAVVIAGALWVHAPVRAQSTTPGNVGWPLHSFDTRGGRFSPLDQINRSNVGKLAVKWTAQPQGTIAQQTPIVVDGLMYLNAGSRLYALNAATGAQVWSYETPTSFAGGGRGPAFGDGRVYAFGPSIIYAVDAKTGTPVESFGQRGQVRIVNDALAFKYPGKYPADLNPTSLGYLMTTPPLYANGMLYVGVPFADSLVPGGLMIAADGRTGKIKWVFNTVPQSPADDGWEITKDTWSLPARHGGGIWTPPSIDLDLGLLYFNASNASPNYDGSSRKGINLFTNSIIALDIQSGKLKWFFQMLHHDLWDWDVVSGPLLFDTTVDGRTVKGVATFGKTCYGYFFDRATGKPLNPIVETPVPTKTDIPGDQAWPTQPIPFTSRGTPQQPFCMTYPNVADPELAARVRPTFHPFQANEFVIISPGNTGGANYGPPSFNPKLGLLFVSGKNDAFSLRIKPVGDTMKPGPGNMGHYGLIAETGKTGITPSLVVAAYEPVSGQLAWSTPLVGSSSAGNLATAGDVVFQGVGNGSFYALDAKTGAELFKHTAPAAIRASPLTYEVGGKQYVAVVASNAVVAYALPD
jgi:PQQ-dependent dehydrogenase (methanol/ethanol family)